MSDDTTIGSGTITETDGLRLRCDYLREQRDQARRWAAAWKARAKSMRETAHLAGAIVDTFGPGFVDVALRQSHEKPACASVAWSVEEDPCEST